MFRGGKAPEEREKMENKKINNRVKNKSPKKDS
jgi:hypothetical protein